MSWVTPIQNVPYRTLCHSGLTIDGASRALVHSCWRVRELNIGFDVGTLPWEFIAVPTWFLSHGHLDHLAALPMLVSRRNLMDLPKLTTVYVPNAIRSDVEELLRIWSKLDQGPQSCNLIGLDPDEEIPLSRDHVVTSFATTHAVPSLGYLVWERRQKLKREYADLPGNALRDLRNAGVAITQEVRIPLLCYTGDTSPAGLDAYPPAYEAKILITEMTVLKPTSSIDRIHAFGHMHVTDFVSRADRFVNERIVAAHVSSRYSVQEALAYLGDNLPDNLRQKLTLWVGPDCTIHLSEGVVG